VRAARCFVGRLFPRTAKALRLDYYSLKKRAAAAARPAERAAEFMEIVPAAAAIPVRECTIEVEDGNGAKMRIRPQGGDLPGRSALLDPDLVVVHASLFHGEAGVSSLPPHLAFLLA
jgi:hypothetical protein